MHRKHSEAVEFDLLTHGRAWRDVGARLPWRDAHVLVRGFARRAECETHRALNPDWWASPEVQLLREVEHAARLAGWIHTADAQKRRNTPQRLPLTAAERLAATPERERFDLHTTDEIDKLIGW